MLHMRHIQTVRRPARRANRRKAQRSNHVARNAVVLVDFLRIVHAAVNLWHVVLCESHEGLDVDENIKGEAEAGVRGFKVLVARAGFVHLDDDEARSQGRCAKDVEEEVSQCASAFLGGGMCGLEDEGGLDGEEESGLEYVSICTSL
jgi:hypothetical protein